MGNAIITIARQHGSGGRIIGELVAKKLGITYYDKELISMTARKTGFALDFVREHYRQGYGQVLAGVFAAYQRSPLWDVWMGDDERPARLEFTAKEELHPYMGTPDVELAFYGDSFLWGLTFGGKGNRFSIEHGLCAIFEGDILTALVDSTDFPNILRWWEEYKANNILTDLLSV